MELGKAIKAARGNRTQAEFAEALGTDQPTLSKWERGAQRPSLEAVRLIEDTAQRPRGFVLVAAGLVDEPVTPEEAVAMDRTLSDEMKQVLQAAIAAARG